MAVWWCRCRRTRATKKEWLPEYWSEKTVRRDERGGMRRNKKRNGKILILNLYDNEQCRRWRREPSRRLRQARMHRKTKEESRNDINIYYTKIYINFFVRSSLARKEIRKVICKTPQRARSSGAKLWSERTMDRVAFLWIGELRRVKFSRLPLFSCSHSKTE